jgi:hypothetical protein
MWNWFNCYLSGRHDYGMWCEPGAIFLRCVHCGRRSSGWSLAATPQTSVAPPKPTMKAPAPQAAHVLAFERQAAARWLAGLKTCATLTLQVFHLRHTRSAGL